jgi:hypothetical protein
MIVRFVSEYEGGVRVDAALGMEVADEAAAYRECARRLALRPAAHRVECWSGGKYVTRATRGYETPEEHNSYKRGPE